MKASLFKAIAKPSVFALACTIGVPGMTKTSVDCIEIANDVKVAVEKAPDKVLMVVEDALVINEGCAADIVKAAIIATNAAAKQAEQIVQTAVFIAPKMAVAINEAAIALLPGLTAVEPSAPQFTISGKNPGKSPVLDSPEPETLDSPEPTFSLGPIRGVFVIPPISGPSPPRSDTNPVSPSNAMP